MARLRGVKPIHVTGHVADFGCYLIVQGSASLTGLHINAPGQVCQF